MAKPKTDCQENNNKDEESDESKQESKEENSAANTLSSVTLKQLNLLTQTISACMSSACSQNSTPSIEFASNLKDSQPASSSIIKKDDSVDIDLKDDIGIISVLRQLSVLETQLGSSATLITNLLGNGLAREKKQAGSSIRLLTPENRLFLDVIKEKLKGQLILEVVPDAMIKATKRCIKSIDELMRVIPEPKLLDPRLNKVSQEKSNSASSPVSLATTHVSFNSRNNFSFSTYSMPSVFPTATVNSVPAHNPSVHVHSASQHPTQVQAVGSQQQNLVRSKPYHAPVPYGTAPGTGYPLNSVHLTNQGRSMAGSATSMPLTTPRQSISNRTASIPKNDAHSDQTTLVPRTLVQSASTGASSFENRSELTKRPSIYDKIPWSEQSSVASIPAAGPPYHLSACSPSFRSSAGNSTSDLQLISATSSYRPQLPPISSSTRPQLSSSISSASHSRTIPASSTARNFQAVPATSSSSDTPVTSVNLPSNDSELHSMVSTFNAVNTTPMISVSYNSVGSPGNSIFSNIATVIPSTDSQIRTASSSTTVVSSSITTSHAIGPIIDLTDDSPDYDESNEPINRLSEARIIQLLKNFRQLPRARQQELVDFLRELEKTNLAVVENFKKYVQLPFNK